MAKPGMRLDDPDYEPEGDLGGEDGAGQKPDEATGEPLSPESGTPEEPTDIPDEYFGVKLAEIEDLAVREQVYESLQEANKVTNARLQELAELRKEAEADARRQRPEPTAPEEPQEFTDEELLQAAGLDPELLRYDEIGKPVLALLERLMSVEQQLQGVSQQTEAAQWEQQFYGTLGELEGEYGKIPYDREDIEAHAIERNIYDPNALYWSIMGPIKAKATVDVVRPNDAVRELKKQVGSGSRRRGSSPTSVDTNEKPKTLQEAYEAAKATHNVPAGHDPFAYEE